MNNRTQILPRRTALLIAAAAAFSTTYLHPARAVSGTPVDIQPDGSSEPGSP